LNLVAGLLEPLTELVALSQEIDELIQSHPHLDFNALQSYKDQVAQHKKDIATEMTQYLQDFAFETPNPSKKFPKPAATPAPSPTLFMSPPTLISDMDNALEGMTVDKPEVRRLATVVEDASVESPAEPSPSPSNRSEFINPYHT
jgi:hypothetical protein